MGTYAKYNNGSLFGEWVKIDDFSDYDEFMAYIRNLHGDERDPEFMMQDYEGYPRAWYYEGGMDEDTFDKIKAFANMDDRDAYEAYVEATGDDDPDRFEENYVGEYDSEEDFAQEIVDEIGWENISNKEYYFDYAAFARDLFISDYVFENGYVFRRY